MAELCCSLLKSENLGWYAPCNVLIGSFRCSIFEDNQTVFLSHFYGASFKWSTKEYILTVLGTAYETKCWVINEGLMHDCPPGSVVWPDTQAGPRVSHGRFRTRFEGSCVQGGRLVLVSVTCNHTSKEGHLGLVAKTSDQSSKGGQLVSNSFPHLTHSWIFCTIFLWSSSVQTTFTPGVSLRLNGHLAFM